MKNIFTYTTILFSISLVTIIIAYYIEGYYSFKYKGREIYVEKDLIYFWIAMPLWGLALILYIYGLLYFF